MFVVSVQDTFVRANQSGWGTSSDGNAWTSQRGAQTLTITSNKGTVAHVGATYEVATLSTRKAANVIETVRFIPGASGDSCGLTVRYQDTSNWYHFNIGNLGQFAEIGKDVAGTFTSLASVAFTWTAGTTYRMKGMIVNTNLYLKVWADSGSEPTAWTVTATDSAIKAAGLFAISCFPSTATAIQFDQFVAQADLESRQHAAIGRIR